MKNRKKLDPELALLIRAFATQQLGSKGWIKSLEDFGLTETQHIILAAELRKFVEENPGVTIKKTCKHYLKVFYKMDYWKHF